MDIQYIFSIIAVNVAGIITSTIIPLLLKRFIKKHLKKKIEEVNEPKQLSEIKEELRTIKKEILEMRGKRK